MSVIARKLASGSALRVANAVASALVSLLIMPFVIRTLGDRMYGIWTLVATFVGYYGMLELGLGTAVTRYLAQSLAAENSEQACRVFNTSLRIYLGLAVLVLVVAGVTAALAPIACKNKADASLFGAVIFILGLSLALQFPTRVFTGALEAHLRFDRTASLELLSLALRTSLMVGLLLLGYKVVAIAWATLLSGLPSMALAIYYTFKELPFLRPESRYWGLATAKTLFSYSIYSLIAGLANILRFQVDNLVVASFIGLAAVTHYRIAGALVQYFYYFMIALMGVFPSVFSRQEGLQDYEAIRRTFFFATKISLCVTCFIAFGMIVWGKPFILRWIGPTYSDAYPVLVALVAAWTINLWQGPAASLLYGVSKHRFIAIVNTIEGVVNLALSIWLVRTQGMLGVALGTLYPMIVARMVIQPAYLCRVLKIDAKDYLRKTGGTLAVIAGALLVPFVASRQLAKPTYPSLLLAGCISAALYALVLWKFEFSEDESDLIRRAIWPRLAMKQKAQGANL
jgi:O-antigen/teichoic acid export membrane protein